MKYLNVYCDSPFFESNCITNKSLIHKLNIFIGMYVINEMFAIYIETEFVHVYKSINQFGVPHIPLA